MNLKILKEGEEGFGIILDNDAGYINKELNLRLNENYNSFDLTQPLIYYATLQKYGIENKNGRIYPQDVLVPQVDLYKQIIAKNASFHELDHPQECHSFDSEILTKDGWKYIKDISEAEEVYTLNQESNNIELFRINKKIDSPYNGKMIHIFGRNIDALVTPNHKFWVTNRRTRKSMFITATDILNKNISNEYFIPKRANWIGNDFSNTIKISGVKENSLWYNCPKKLIEKYTTDIEFDAITFFGFMGIWLAEGSVRGSKGGLSGGYGISIAQKDPKKIELIRELLNKTPFNWVERTSRNGIDFTCSDARLHAYLKPIGNSKTKYIPEELKGASPNLLNELFEWFLMGDGRTRGNKKDVFSTSKKLIDDLHEILIKMGGSGNIHEEDRKQDRLIEGRLIKGENCSNMFFLNVSSTEGVYLDFRMLTAEEVDYNNNIYCVDVPNHIFYFRRNGKSAWSGNSVISLKGGSPHRILEVFWEGNVLIGKIEILISKGYRDSGIISCDGDMVAHYLSYGMTLGISSRGVGSLKKIQGKNIVQKDYELICFDIVSSPSTPGSYIYKDPSDFKKYDEVINTDKSVTISPEVFKDRQQEFMSQLSSFLNK